MNSPSPPWLWTLGVALLGGLLGLYAVWPALGDPLMVQDDARHHVVWLLSSLDPALFPRDAIAHMFTSSNLPLYKALYALPAHVGINPLELAKLYPVLLSAAAAAAMMALGRSLNAPPRTAALLALLFVQMLWLDDDLASATARAFAWPLFIGFLAAFTARRWGFAALCALLQGGIYPATAVLSLAVVGVDWLHQQARAWQKNGPPTLPAFALSLCPPLALTLATAALLLPAMLLGPDHDPTIKASVARTYAEFQAGGRAAYFLSDPLAFWLLEARSGWLPAMALRAVPLVLLALLYAARHRVAPPAEKRLMLHLLLAATVCWAVAHALLFALHLPGRFSFYAWATLIPLAAGLMAARLIDRFVTTRARQITALTALLLWPFTLNVLTPFPGSKWAMADTPRLLALLAASPKEATVAGLAPALDMVPAVAHRSVLTAREFLIPYKTHYLADQERKLAATITALAAPDARGVAALAQRYHPAWLLVEDRFYTAPDAALQQAWWTHTARRGGTPPPSLAARQQAWLPRQTHCRRAHETGQSLYEMACLTATGAQD